MNTEYDPKSIETKWQQRWEETAYGMATDFSESKKHYHLVEFPYPSGAGLHVGHCMGYGASDAYCRMKRLQGYNVMFPIGWDAFGLPTENFAIKNKIKPADATEKNVTNFKKQMKSLGLSFDWGREVNTTDPRYYRWTQWIFLQFYRHAVVNGKLVEVTDDDTNTPRLAFQAEMPVNWCPSCKIVLANEEVINGKCERCGHQTEVRKQKQWMLRITAYADRLIDDLDTVNYLHRVKTQQINWIGRSSGVMLKEKVKDLDISFEVYDSVPQTFIAQTFAVIAPEHPLVEKLITGTEHEKPVKEFVERIRLKKQQDKFDIENDLEGIFTGRYVENPFGTGDLPIWIASYVLADYGTGIVNCSAHDERDFAFAKKYGIPLRTAMQPSDPERAKRVENLEECYARDPEGIISEPAEFAGQSWKSVREGIIEHIVKKGFGYPATQFKLRDWIFSRQHYWGEPIPIIHCEKCGTVPVPQEQLPVVLPDVENYEPTSTGESPLAKMTDWVTTTCPVCGSPAKRETDTMPNWAGSSWYYLAYAMNQDAKIDQYMGKDIFSQYSQEMKYWAPVDIYNGGMEHTTLHLLYSRFWHKFLFDLGVVPTSEPYSKRIAHGIILGPDGRKMSKSFGNVINPDEIVTTYGADTLRAYVMFIGPYDQESAWSNAGVQGVARFLKRIWANAHKLTDSTQDPKELLIKLNQTIQGIREDLEEFKLNTYIAKLMELNNAFEKLGTISKESFKKFLLLLFPAAPHIASELWEQLECGKDISEQKWPEADAQYLIAETIEYPVQVNGKLRFRVLLGANATQDEILAAVRSHERYAEAVGDRPVKKEIIVPGRLVSLVV